MASMLVLAAILFVLITLAGFQLVTTYQSSQAAIAILQNQTRLQMVASQVRAALAVVDDRTAVPVRSDLSSGLPPVTPFTTNASGAPIVFCPVLPSPVEEGRAYTNTAAAETWQVQTAERDGLTYVVAGAPGGPDDKRISDMGIVAYLLSPQPNAKSALRCADARVAEDGSTILVKGGSVVSVFGSAPDADAASFVLSADGSRPDWATTADRTARSLDEVLEFVRHYDVHDVRLRLSGAETVSGTVLDELLSLSYGRTVRFEGPSGVRAVLNIDGGPSPTQGVTEVSSRGFAAFSNVSLVGTGGTEVLVAASPGGSVLLENSQTALVRSNGGSVTLAGTTRLTPSTSSAAPIYADGGSVTINVVDSEAAPFLSASAAPAMLLAAGGDIVVKSDARIQAGGSELFRQLPGGRFRLGTEGARLLVDRGTGYVPETPVDLQRVSQTCADGASSCSATCPAGKTVAWGECGSANGSPLSSFSVDGTGASYTCQFSPMSVALSPQSAVVCRAP